MKEILLSLIVFSLTLFGLSCAPLTQKVVEDALLPPFETGTTVSLINYDSIYYSMAYYLSKHKWPTTKEELSDYAASKNHKINFDQYSYYSIEQSSTNRINIHFIIKKVEIHNSYINNVKGIVGIYIEDEKNTKIYSYEDKKIISSFTVAKYPYDTKNIEAVNGYSVHNYIEYVDSHIKASNGNNATMNNQPMFRMQELNIK